MVKRRKGVKFYARICTLLLVIILIWTGCYFYFKKTVEPAIIDASIVTVRSLGTNIVNDSAKSALEIGVNYEDLFTLEKDSSGKIKLIKSNSLEINTVMRQIASFAQKQLDELGGQNITLPVGTLSGVALLTGFGPNVSIKITPIGAVDCDFISVFEEAGINQTLHRLYIGVVANIKIITPLEDAQISVGSEFLICENLIVGEIPSTYLNFGKLDLLP